MLIKKNHEIQSDHPWSRTITVAFTGASGIRYGLRLLECLLAVNTRVFLLISPTARIILKTEAGIASPTRASKATDFFCNYFQAQPGQLRVFGLREWTASLASGSNPPDAMVICPCTVGTLGRLAAGLADDLIERAADVILKERRDLILVIRETPLTTIHLTNMLHLAQAGAIIMPASPGFYHMPTQITDLIDFIVARILAHLRVSHDLITRWG